jgi:hypothetical protein
MTHGPTLPFSSLNRFSLALPPKATLGGAIGLLLRAAPALIAAAPVCIELGRRSAAGAFATFSPPGTDCLDGAMALLDRLAFERAVSGAAPPPDSGMLRPFLPMGGIFEFPTELRRPFTPPI